MRKSPIVRVTLCAALLSIFVLAIPPSPAISSETLPPEAQEAVARGLAAARQQDWPLAVRYFSEARKSAPAAPQVIFNLALACDKAGGRDLPAVTLYRAYLASTPGAANAAQIQARVLELEVRAESDTIRLLQKAKEMYELLPQQGLIFPSRSSFYAYVVQVERGLGRFAEAERSISLIDDPNLRDVVSRSPLEARIKAYDFERALKILPRPHESPYNLQLYSGLVKTGQLERLREIAERITDEGKKAETCDYLFSALLGAGDLKGAAGLIEKIPPGSRPNGYRSLSQKLLQSGEIAGALDAAARADEKFRVSLMLEVAKEQARRGDASGAASNIKKCMTTAEGVRNDAEPLDGLLRIASVQIDLGMKADALGTVRKALAAVKKPSDSDLSRICEVQAWAGDMEGARKTVEMFSEADKTRENLYRLSAYLHLANAQAFAGDKAGARETLSRVEPFFPKNPSSDIYTYYVASAMGAAEDEEGLKKFLAGKPQGFTPEFARAMPYFDLFYRRTELHDKTAARKCLDKALSIASECREPYYAGRIYNFVFWKVIASGEKTEAEEIIQRVTALLPRISDPKEKDITNGSLSNVKVQFNDIQGAVEAASQIADEKVRDAAYKKIFEARIKARDTQGAVEIAKRISSLCEKRMASNALANLMASQGRYKESMAMEDLSKSLSNAKSYAELDEAKSWSTLADKAFGKPPLADLKGYIEGLKGDRPGDQAYNTVKAAQEMAWALEELRKEAAKWQAYGAIRQDNP